ncbi:MAG TPA: hypothetical protein VL989_01420 [Candidatus Sulfotelmatobacter sp.]|nr:hypothetical protein [Candidatus Sulfotelmatobacter sp.]
MRKKETGLIKTIEYRREAVAWALGFAGLIKGVVSVGVEDLRRLKEEVFYDGVPNPYSEEHELAKTAMGRGRVIVQFPLERTRTPDETPISPVGAGATVSPLRPLNNRGPDLPPSPDRPLQAA